MKSEETGSLSSVFARGDRDERLEKVCESLRAVLVEVDDLGLTLVGAMLDGAIVTVERERDRSSR